MHIQDKKAITKTSAAARDPKHSFLGNGRHQPKHLQEIPKKKNKGITAFVIALVFLIGLIMLREYAILFAVPAVVSMVLSICAAAKRTTFFSVTAVVISGLVMLLTAAMIVFVSVKFFTGTSMAAFTILS